MSKKNIDINDEIWFKIKIKALEHHKSLTKYLNELLEKSIVKGKIESIEKIDNKKLVVKEEKIVKVDNIEPIKDVVKDELRSKYDCFVKGWWNPQDYCSKHNVNHLSNSL